MATRTAATVASSPQIKPLPGKPRTLAPVRPNAGLEAEYRRRLDALVAEMQASLLYWLKMSYRREAPEIAQDKTPAEELNAAVKKLGRKWQRKFDDIAPVMAEHFATAVMERNSAALRASMRKAGMTVKFTLSEPANDALQAVIAENIGLIKSIASEHLTEVQGLLMRSVSRGRSLSEMTQEMEKRYGITRRRAALIARDQNNKATAIIQQVRQKELGIKEAVWVHSTAGKVPRPAHVAMNGKRYLVADGMFDPDEGKKILPGELINCRCYSRPVIPGLS